MAAALRTILNGPSTITELATTIDLTRPAAEAVAHDLHKIGWISPTAPPSDTRTLGRPATYWGLSAHAGNVHAIDIGGRHVSVATATIDGTIHALDRVEVSPDATMDHRLNTAFSLVDAQRSNDTTTHRCVVSTPGIHHDGIVTYYGGTGIRGLQGFALQHRVQEQLNIPTLTVGDCALGARGESWNGAAKGFRDVVYILAGHRTGAATVIDGRAHLGFASSAGLIGELPALHWRDLEAETFAVGLYHGTAPTRDIIFTEAQAGNTTALAAVATYARTLAQGAAAMILAIAPQAVVIGGQYSAYADLFLTDFTRELERICPFMPEILTSTLGADAVVIGGVSYALDSIYDALTHAALNTGYFPSAHEPVPLAPRDVTTDS